MTASLAPKHLAHTLVELQAQYGKRNAVLFAKNHGLYGFPQESCAALARQEGISRERTRQIISNIGVKLGWGSQTGYPVGPK